MTQFATVFWVGFSHIPGTLKDSHVTRVPVTAAFQPTQSRSWVIDFWNLDVKWVFVALPFGFLVMLLFYYDHVSCFPPVAVLSLLYAHTTPRILTYTPPA